MGSRHAGSIVVAHRLTCFKACGIFSEQGSNLGPLHCKADSLPLDHRRSSWKPSLHVSSVAQSCPVLCDPMDCNMPVFPVHHQLSELAQTHVHWVSDAFQPSHLILCHPLLFLPSFFPSIRGFSSESVLPVHHHLPEFTQAHIHRVGDAIQPSHPLLSPSSPAPNPSQHQSLFQWVNSSHEVAKVLEFQLQLQSFQWIFRTDFL